MKLLQKMRSSEKGFTLIELLVVIAIIGILATIIIVNIAGARSKAQDARVQSDVRAIMNAVELYIADNNVIPTAIGVCTTTSNFASALSNGDICSGNAFVSGSNTLLAKIPAHPTSTQKYKFTGTAGTATYAISGLLVSDATKTFTCANGACTTTP